MKDICPLRASPIIEALIDFQYEVDHDASIEDLNIVARNVATTGDFLVRSESSFGDADFGNSKKIIDTILVTSRDESVVIRLRQSGVTVSQARAYLGWEALETLALSVNDAFIEQVRPVRTVRAAAKYTNHVHLPQGDIDLDDFFTCGPRVPAGSLQLVVDFENRTVFVDKALQLGASVLLATTKREPGARSPFLLDIDVFSFEINCTNSECLRPVLKNIRKTKNEIFFGSLTERLLETLA